MANAGKSSMERFQVTGNVLKITPRFDPRYQARAGTELMNIVSSLATEGQDPDVVLDISDAQALPSMMLGILVEAKDLAGKAGKNLKVRLTKDTYDRLSGLGLGGMFAAGADGAPEGLEILMDSSSPKA